MAQKSSIERDIERLEQLSADLFKGLDAAEAVLLDHSNAEARLSAINFPLEEGLFEEAVRLMADWKSQAANLIRSIDADVADQALSYERLFDKHAGRQSNRHSSKDARRRNVPPQTIVAALSRQLGILRRLDAILQQAGPLFGRNHRQCEYHLIQLVERRQKADQSIEETSRAVADLKARLVQHQADVVSVRNAEALAVSEQDRKALASRLKVAEVNEEVLYSERETLVRLIADGEGFVETMNSLIGAVQVISAKSVTDGEHAIGVLKAALIQAGMPEADLPAPVAVMVANHDASPLSGLGLFERRQNANAAFSRRFDTLSPPDEILPDDEVSAEATAADDG